MTLEEFYAGLERHGLRFHLDGQEIRDDGDRCPLCALARAELGLEFGNPEFDRAALVLGLDHSLDGRIATAADYDGGGYYQETEIRRRLLEFTELKESED
jgi:hypothetical protein